MGTKISALAAATALTGAEIIPIVQDGATKRVALSALAAFLGASAPATPSVALSSPSAAEGNSGTTNLAFTATLARNGVTGAIPFTWAVTGGTAVAADYVGGALPSGSGTFASGSSTATINVPVQGDAAVEPDETCVVTITLSSPYAAVSATSTGTITNDDASAPPSSPVDASTNFADSFNSGTTLLYQRPGWAAENGSYLTAWSVSGTEIVGGTGDGTNKGTNFITHDLGSAAAAGGFLRMRCVSGAVGVLVFGLTDANNFFYFLHAGPNAHIGKVVAGVDTNLLDSPSVPILAAGDTVELGIFNRKIYAKRNGITAFSDLAIDTSGQASAPPIGTKYGVSTFYDEFHWDDFYCSSLAGTLAFSHTNFYPSDFNTTIASAADFTGRTATFSGAYSGTTPTALQARLLDEDLSGAVLYDWFDCTGLVAASGNWTVDVPLPCGNFIPEFRHRNDTSIRSFSAANSLIGVGATGAITGQSNAGFFAQFGTSDSLITPYTNARCYAFDRNLAITAASSTWARSPNNVYSTMIAWWMSQSLDLGVSPTGRARGKMPVGICGGGIGSQPIEYLRKGSTQLYDDGNDPGTQKTHWTLLTNNIAAAKAIGRIAFADYDQGEAEGDLSGGVQDFALYQSRLIQYVVDFRTDFSGGKQTAFFITLTGRQTGAANADQDVNYSGIRATQENTAGSASRYVGIHNVGVLMADGYHYATAGAVQRAMRLGKAALYRMFGLGFNGTGPTAGTPVISGGGATATIPINANGATSFSALSGLDGTTAGNASALTAWQASNDNFATLLTISGAVLSGSNIVLTGTGMVSGTTKFRNHYGKNPDISSYPFGNYADGTKIAMKPIVNAVTAA